MDPNSDDEIQEMMEEFSHDLGRNLGKEEKVPYQRSSLDSVFHENPIMWSAIAIAILLSLFSLFFNDGSDSLTKDMDFIKTRIDQIEKRMAILEESLNETGSFSTQINNIKQSISKLSGSDKSLNAGIKKLNTSLTTLSKELESIKKDFQNQAGKAVSPSSSTGMRQYTVKKGDTLYSISQKNNVRIEELRKLNKLKKDQDITIGQNLIIPDTGS